MTKGELAGMGSTLRQSLWAGLLMSILAMPLWAQPYSLTFSKSSDRLTWRPSFPSWSYSTPVTLASRDTTSQLRLTAATSLSAWYDERRKVWTESASVRSSLLYPILGPRASIGVSANMSSRNATLLSQRVRSQTISFRFGSRPLSGGRESPFDDLRINLTPGVITARRASQANRDSTIEETGLQYRADLTVSPTFEIKDQNLNTSVSLGKTDNTLKNNKNRNENLRVSSSYTFPGDIRTTVSFNESRSQQGVTRAIADSAVAELSERRNTGANVTVALKALGFDFSTRQSWSQSLNTNTANDDDDVRNRFFARDRENENWDVSSRVSGRLAESVTASVSLGWSGTDERRLPVKLYDGITFRDPTDDREDRSVLISGRTEWQIEDANSVSLSGSSRTIRVNNPGAPEQDRDSYTGSVTLGYNGTRSSGLRYDTSLSIRHNRRISLDVSRSTENQRNRELRLATNTSYQRLGTSLSHSFEISARRTIFDFDRQINLNLVDRRSNIRRGWTMRHNLRRKVFNALQLTGSYSFSADDFGTLLLEDESQVVEEDNTDHRISVGMSYRPSDNFSIGTNFSYRLDRKWTYDYSRGGDRDLEFHNAHRNLGANVEYRPDGLTALVVRSSRSKQRSGTFDSLNVTLSRTL